MQLWGNQDHADQSILSYLPLSKQSSRCMCSFCQNHRAATHAQLKYNHVLQWKAFERAPTEPRPHGSNTAVWMKYFIKLSVPYFVDRELERLPKAGWFLMWEAWLMETLFVVYSMPHNESGFKGLPKAWISSFVDTDYFGITRESRLLYFSHLNTPEMVARFFNVAATTTALPLTFCDPSQKHLYSLCTQTQLMFAHRTVRWQDIDIALSCAAQTHAY